MISLKGLAKLHFYPMFVYLPSQELENQKRTKQIYTYKLIISKNRCSGDNGNRAAMATALMILNQAFQSFIRRDGVVQSEL
jgi:hypothetical protein